MRRIRHNLMFRCDCDFFLFVFVDMLIVCLKNEIFFVHDVMAATSGILNLQKN